MAVLDTHSPVELGAALARDFVHAQWLRIHIGSGAAMPPDELDYWCPHPRIRFRTPPWWPAHGHVIRDDRTLHAIYRAFAEALGGIAASSDDPALNTSIAAATAHIDRMLADESARTEPTPQDFNHRLRSGSNLTEKGTGS